MKKNNDILGKERLANKMEKLKQEMNAEKTYNGKNDIVKPNIKTSKLPAEEEQVKNKTTPKLFISGRLDRKKYTYVAKSLSLLAELEKEIKIYCRGGDLAILNYLIKEGLKHVKMSDVPINIEVKEIESDIN